MLQALPEHGGCGAWFDRLAMTGYPEPFDLAQDRPVEGRTGAHAEIEECFGC